MKGFAVEQLDWETLKEANRENRAALRNKLRELRGYRELQAKLTSFVLAEAIEQTATEVQIDNFMSNKQTPLPRKGHEMLVRHLWDNRWWGDTWLHEGIAAHPSALFHAFCSFFSAGEQTSINLKNEAIGTYRLWRASMHVPGKYVLGKLVISNDIQTGSVRATEIQAFRGSGQVASAREVFEGFIVKKSRYFMIIARQAGKHRGAPRMTMVHNAVYEDGLVRALYGVVIGCYGSNHLFSTPIYAERVDEASASAVDDELDIQDSIPDAIKSKLRFRMDDNHVIHF